MTELTDEMQRRADDLRLKEIFERLGALEIGQVALQHDVQQLAPKVEVVEKIGSLERSIEKLFYINEQSSKDFKTFANETGQSLKNLSAVNEENMKLMARQSAESHAVEIKRLEGELEDRSFTNQMKNWTVIAGGIVAISGAAAYLYQIIAHLPK